MYGHNTRPSLGQHDVALSDSVLNGPPHHSRANVRPPQAESSIRSLQQVQGDSSSSESTFNSRPKPLNKHSRSMSHPFPSLFSIKRKKNVAANELGHDEDDEDDDVDDSSFNTRIFSGTSQAIAQAMNPNRRNSAQTEFVTGNCMTCASLVRWPKELHIFRCTKCLTINDLKPFTVLPRPTIRAVSGPVQAQSNEILRLPINAPIAISLDHTRVLIKTCLRSALQQWASRDQRNALYDQSPAGFTDDDGSKPESSSSSVNTSPGSRHNSVSDDFAKMGLEPNPLKLPQNLTKSYSTSFPETTTYSDHLKRQQQGNGPRGSMQDSILAPKAMFKKVEDYLNICFGSHSCVNNSFIPRRASVSSRVPTEPMRRPPIEARRESIQEEAPISELDPKLLLLGDFAENGSWWTGKQEGVNNNPRVPSWRHDEKPSIVTFRSPNIDWGAALEWYHIVANAAESWMEVYQELLKADTIQSLDELASRQFDSLVLEAQEHLQRVLLKCMEMLLKRPGRLMAEPQDVRFLLLFLANPVLASGYQSYTGCYSQISKGKQYAKPAEAEESASAGRHSGIIKRIFGLLANSSEPCHHHLIGWLSRLPEHLLVQIKDLATSFVTYRLTRQNERKPKTKVDITDGLIPQMPNARAGNTPATLHAALGASQPSKKQKQPVERKRTTYTEDWQIKAAARFTALIFAANNHTHVRRRNAADGRMYGHLFATSDFYNTLVDTLDFQSDFELWESRRGKFTFCQYPFFLSIWAKIQILEFDARRQMAGRAREAFFDSILTHKNYTQHLVFTVRRECLVDDSLQQVSEIVGSGSEDIKKGLRIEFQGEEGIDGGGLRKEWFLLLVREVFNPDHGLFVYDEDSNFCYFNPNTFETSDQYFLVGVVLGLAIHNSTILDVAFPPFAFRKLLASAPSQAAGAAGHSRPIMNYTLDDLAEFRPALARGLRQLLSFDGDVQSTFCLDFVVDVEKYGTRVRVPLCAGGETRMVTNANRKEYVDLYVRYLLDTSVVRQFEPFKRGFFTVCAGNALTLFKPEEIELLVRGSDESLDVASLKTAAVYTNWPKGSSPLTEPTILWFWDTFEHAASRDQRKLLSFITGSDRIPAMGAASLVIKINCLGDDEGRFPSARTCFNSLSLYRYRTRERLETCLWRAVNESEGFGLK